MTDDALPTMPSGGPSTPEAGRDHEARGPRQVLVFGATGYVGSHLVPRLSREPGTAVRASGMYCGSLAAPWLGGSPVT